MINGIFDNSNIIVDASNVKTSDNPPFTLGDFYSIYPQFSTLDIPVEVSNMYLSFANECVNIDRWGQQSWKLGMSLFLAHFLTIYLMSFSPESSAANQVIAAGQAKGLISSKSVGDVSVSYDFSAAVTGVESWGQFNTTEFGKQFANLAKLIGKGGMYIW